MIHAKLYNASGQDYQWRLSRALSADHPLLHTSVARMIAIITCNSRQALQCFRAGLSVAALSRSVRGSSALAYFGGSYDSNHYRGNYAETILVSL
jgi:hypothetical protein